MRSRMLLLRGGMSFATLALAGLAVARPAQAATECSVQALSALKIPDLAVASADIVAAKDADPEFCDVKGSVATHGEGAGANEAGYEIRLPARWNGKFLFFGVGGLAGSLRPSANRVDVGEALGKGYATAITDTGHTGTNPFDASWILAAPGKLDAAKVADYWYRSAHQVTLAGKLLVKRYYGAKTIKRAYFDGCSFGGHMGLMEAMRYPDDYDGIVAGAPFMDNRTQLWGYKNAKAFLNAYIPAETLAKVDDAVKASCDAADGARDGLIQNPAKCAFDPDSLVPGTLTQAQADALKVFFRPATDEKGRAIYPGSSVSDLSAGAPPLGGFMGWVEKGPPADVNAAEPWGKDVPVLWAAAEGFIKNFDLRDPGFNMNADWPEKDGRIAAKAFAQFSARFAVGDVDQPARLERYLRQGKKLILYHGFGDTAISPFRTVWFYEDFAKRSGGYAKAQGQVRLFMVPDMLHCSGGPGPNAFDTLTALEEWTEHGKAPDAIRATKYNEDKADKGAARTMPLCKFPEQARYKGSGDVNDAANWTCPPGDRLLLEVGANGIAAGLGSGRH